VIPNWGVHFFKLNDHLAIDALEQRYRQATYPVARSHW
jgi:hypothetical protein